MLACENSYSPPIGVRPEHQERESDWSSVVSRIKLGDNSAASYLYGTILQTIRHKFMKSLNFVDVDDAVQDVAVRILTGINEGKLRDPRALPGYANSIARNVACERIRTQSRRRECCVTGDVAIPGHEQSQDEVVALGEKRQLVADALELMTPLDREILVRFYYQEQRPDQIMADLGLTSTQYRLRKSRAKQRLVSVTKRLQGRRRLSCSSSALLSGLVA